MGKRPLILEVKGNSLDDGPGIRTVVFFKGCPLSCVWCHNPESRRNIPEISFDKNVCLACDFCLSACGKGALDRRNPRFIDRCRCDCCFACVEQCPSGALARVGREMTPGKIMEEIRKDIPFFRTSGGGVTLSGGEPTISMEFTSMLLKKLKGMNVDVLLETCGHFSLRRFEELLYPYIKEIYFDIKLMDEGEHLKYCGVSNGMILKNFIHLNKLYQEGGKGVLPRIPLIPGITATEKNLRAASEFLRNNGVRKLALLPYNPLWIEKAEKLGAAGTFLPGIWMSQPEINACRDIFSSFEIA